MPDSLSYKILRPGWNRNGRELEQVVTIYFQATSLPYRNCPEISVLCVNKSPMRYDFRAGQELSAVCSVDIASVVLGELVQLLSVCH